MTSRARAPFAVAALAQLLLAGQLSAATVQQTEEHTFPLTAGGEVVVENVNGNIDLTTWERDEVRVVANKEAKSGDRDEAEAYLEKLRLEITHREDYLHVETEHPRSSGGGFFDWLLGRDVSSSVHYEVTVPASSVVAISTINGRVEIAGARGEVSARSTNGRVELFDVHGPVDARTTNGAIRAELAALAENGEVSLATVNGSISLYLPEDVRADLDARTTNGSIKSDLDVDGELSRRRNRLQGRINGGGGHLDLRAVNGSIRLVSR